MMTMNVLFDDDLWSLSVTLSRAIAIAAGRSILVDNLFKQCVKYPKYEVFKVYLMILEILFVN